MKKWAVPLADMVPSLLVLQVCLPQDMVGLVSFAPHMVCFVANGLVV